VREVAKFRFILVILKKNLWVWNAESQACSLLNLFRIIYRGDASGFGILAFQAIHFYYKNM